MRCQIDGGAYSRAVLIDDHAKDGRPGKSDFCVAFTMCLCILESKQTLISSLFQVILVPYQIYRL